VPKLLSNLVKNAQPRDVIITPDAAAREPVLAALAAQAIAISSQADYFLGRVLIDMLGPQAAPAFAMYEALWWGYSKKQALKAAAKMVLTAADFELFVALLKVYGQDQEQRNKLAHWLWVYCEQAPGYLILLHPLDALRRDFTPQIPPGAGGMRPADRVDNCFCYSKAELDKIVETFTETLVLIEQFRNLVGVPGAPKDYIRNLLATQHRMVEALRHPEKPNQTLP
jgi:hypothetical protein